MSFCISTQDYKEYLRSISRSPSPDFTCNCCSKILPLTGSHYKCVECIDKFKCKKCENILYEDKKHINNNGNCIDCYEEAISNNPTNETYKYKFNEPNLVWQKSKMLCNKCCDWCDIKLCERAEKSDKLNVSNYCNNCYEGELRKLDPSTDRDKYEFNPRTWEWELYSKICNTGLCTNHVIYTNSNKDYASYYCQECHEGIFYNFKKKMSKLTIPKLRSILSEIQVNYRKKDTKSILLNILFPYFINDMMPEIPYENMTKAELVEIGSGLGISVFKSWSKTKIINTLNNNS
jgi:hypothetical protein